MNKTATCSRSQPPPRIHRNNSARAAAAIPHGEEDPSPAKPDSAYASALSIIAEQTIRDTLGAEELVEQKLSALLFMLPDGCSATDCVQRMLEALEKYDEERSLFLDLLNDQNRAAHFSRASLATTPDDPLEEDITAGEPQSTTTARQKRAA